MDAFQKALGITLGHEGIYSDDPYDTGGKTKWGITENVARIHGYDGRMCDLPLETAQEIYRVDYWRKNRLDEVAKYDETIAIEMFDTGVNMGTLVAAYFLQRAINCLNRNQTTFDDLEVDGIIGSKTIEVLSKLNKQNEKRSVFKMLNALQGARYIEICENDPTKERFIRGWLQRVP